MSHIRIISAILFVVGLILVSTGVGLSNISQTARTLMGNQTTHPYLGVGLVTVITGTAVLFAAYVMILREKAQTNALRLTGSAR